MMKERILAYCRQFHLLEQGERLIVACSGGPDSLVLLDILAQLREIYALQLMVVYIHHHLRAAADEEVRFVQAEAAKRQCPFMTLGVDVPALVKARKQSVETVARQERYRLLREAKDRQGATAIAVAHHQHDQAETVLHHLLRGSGLTGLCGMAPRTGDIIRPLLGVSRTEIMQYVQEQGLQPREDETNRDTTYLRNRLRWDVLPLLQQINPACVTDISHMTTILQAEETWIQTMVQTSARHIVQRQGEDIYIKQAPFLACPVALQRRLLRYACETLCGERQGLSFTHVETLRALFQKETGKQFFTRQWRAVRTYDAVILTRQSNTPLRDDTACVPIDGAGDYDLGMVRIHLDIDRLYGNACTDGQIDYARIPDGAVFRYRKPGDYLCYHGYTKTLKKWLQEKKIPAARRGQLPLLCNGSQVLWIYGFPPFPAIAIQHDTTHIGRITLVGGTVDASRH